MFSVRGLKFKHFAMIMGVICIILGVYLTFFHSAGFVKTEATIVSIEEVPGETSSDDEDYIVTVTYTVDGQNYQSELDSYSPSYKEGKTIDVLYNPNDPSVVHGGKGMSLYVLVVGIVILAISVLSGMKNKKALEKIQEQRRTAGANAGGTAGANAGSTAGANAVGTAEAGTAVEAGAGSVATAGSPAGTSSSSFAPSVKGAEREVYFLTDVGTPKYGHRIEDRNRKVLYEAKMTNFSLISAYSFDFIDHEHGTVNPHLVGHEEEIDWGNSLLFDSHYTFELDGEDVWKYLKRNGISAETERMEGSILPRYRVMRDGQQIALIESSSRYVHEEDAEKHDLMSKVAVPGFYRIWTSEENLDAVFMTAMAFGRSGALNDEGGTYGKIIRNKIKQ